MEVQILWDCNLLKNVSGLEWKIVMLMRGCCWKKKKLFSQVLENSSKPRTFQKKAKHQNIFYFNSEDFCLEQIKMLKRINRDKGFLDSCQDATGTEEEKKRKKK